MQTRYFFSSKVNLFDAIRFGTPFFEVKTAILTQVARLAEPAWWQNIEVDLRDTAPHVSVVMSRMFLFLMLATSFACMLSGVDASASNLQ